MNIFDLTEFCMLKISFRVVSVLYINTLNDTI